MFRRVSEFAARHKVELTGKTNMLDLFQRLDAVIARLDTGSSGRAVERTNRRVGTVARERARAA
ncbi:MAG: hypothetical protein ACKV2V_26915 [Blastocatellia bacterium]